MYLSDPCVFLSGLVTNFLSCCLKANLAGVPSDNLCIGSGQVNLRFFVISHVSPFVTLCLRLLFSFPSSIVFRLVLRLSSNFLDEVNILQ